MLAPSWLLGCAESRASTSDDGMGNMPMGPTVEQDAAPLPEGPDPWPQLDASSGIEDSSLPGLVESCELTLSTGVTVDDEIDRCRAEAFFDDPSTRLEYSVLWGSERFTMWVIWDVDALAPTTIELPHDAVGITLWESGPNGMPTGFSQAIAGSVRLAVLPDGFYEIELSGVVFEPDPDFAIDGVLRLTLSPYTCTAC